MRAGRGCMHELRGGKAGMRAAPPGTRCSCIVVGQPVLASALLPMSLAGAVQRQAGVIRSFQLAASLGLFYPKPIFSFGPPHPPGSCARCTARSTTARARRRASWLSTPSSRTATHITRLPRRWRVLLPGRASLLSVVWQGRLRRMTGLHEGWTLQP